MNELNEVIFYKPIHFKIQELVSEKVYKDYGEKAWQFFDSRLLWTIDKIRAKYGSIIINDWSWGGSWQNRGYRDKNCKIGAENSQHRHGRGVDFNFKDEIIPNSEMRKLIKENPNCEEFKYITAIEDFKGMSWVHIDVRNSDKNKNGLLIFNK